jgi:hypothetical protein
MLRLTISADERVLVCWPVAWPVRELSAGSTQVPCAECDQPVWRALGAPPMRWAEDGSLVPNTLQVQPTLVLCIPCAQAHRLNVG